MNAEATDAGDAGDPAANPERAEARLAAFRLIESVQTGERDHDLDLARQIGRAERRLWPEVRRVLRYAEVLRAMVPRRANALGFVERLREAAEREGDQVLLALALATRAELRYGLAEQPTDQADSDADLARATALLDRPGGGALERATAYVACGLAYGQRDLWELEEEMYAEAATMLPACEEPLIDRVLLYNNPPLQLWWACALREVGESAAVRHRVEQGLAAAEAALSVAAPTGWVRAVRAERYVLAAVGGLAEPEPAASVLADLNGNNQGLYEGYLLLGMAIRALATHQHRAAEELVNRALPLIGEEHESPLYSLAHRVAAEAELGQHDGPSQQTLRYAEHAAHHGWQARLRLLGSARARLRAERLRAERDLRAKEAMVDELTGVASRRGYARYIDSLKNRAADRQVAVLIADVDRFKRVNDEHGHLAGDEVLRRLGRVLLGTIRPTDIAARLGGDEFVVLLDHVAGALARRRAEQLLARLHREPWQEIVPGLTVSVSIGVATGPAERMATLVALADEVLYAAKARGGGRVGLAAEVPAGRQDEPTAKPTGSDGPESGS